MNAWTSTVSIVLILQSETPSTVAVSKERKTVGHILALQYISYIFELKITSFYDLAGTISICCHKYSDL